MNELAAVNGQGAALPTILGESPVRFPIGGKIRAGIKVLTKTAAAHERAREIYQRGVEAGLDFDAIEKEIAHAAPDLKNACGVRAWHRHQPPCGRQAHGGDCWLALHENRHGRARGNRSEAP